MVEAGGGGKTMHPATHSPTNQHPLTCTHPPTMQGLFPDAHHLTVKTILSLRARIYDERILNRIDSNRLFFSTRLEIDSIAWKNTALGSIRKPRIVLEFCEIGKTQHLTEQRADSTRGEQMSSTACIVACSPPTVSVFFGGAV